MVLAMIIFTVFLGREWRLSNSTLRINFHLPRDSRYHPCMSGGPVPVDSYLGIQNNRSISPMHTCVRITSRYGTT